MKRLLMLLAILALVVSPAFASYEYESEADVTNVTNITNEVVERDDPRGIQLDVIVYESDVWWAEQVTVETRFDLENKEEAIFLVAQVNAYKFITSLFGGGGE